MTKRPENTVTPPPPHMGMSRLSWAMIMAACTLLLLVIGVFGYAQVPADSLVAIHFDFSGAANGWTTPGKALFFLPIISAALLALGWFIPTLNPRTTVHERKIVAYLFLGGARTFPPNLT